jgi:hypothetical protein
MKKIDKDEFAVVMNDIRSSVSTTFFRTLAAFSFVHIYQNANEEGKHVLKNFLDTMAGSTEDLHVNTAKGMFKLTEEQEKEVLKNIRDVLVGNLNPMQDAMGLPKGYENE